MIRQQEITEMLNQKKTNSRTPLGPTRARANVYLAHQQCMPLEDY